jgi:IrrE N-terminal-like domain
MSGGRREFIRNLAQEARNELLRHRYDNGGAPAGETCGIEPEKIIRIRNITFLEPVEIRLHSDLAKYHVPPRYAGYMDPARNTIAVARNLPPEVRQFTMAHELGHATLHREKGILFRDLPNSGADLENESLAPEEKEANTFAADLLMPEELVCLVFLRYFGEPTLAGVRRDERIAFQLSTPQRRVTAAQLNGRSKRFLSLLLADSRPWLSPTMPTLCNLFRVSKIAMAIQLEAFKLV